MAEQERVRVENSAVRCPYCHDGVDVAAGAWVACSACLARHHGECWGEAGKCGACGAAEPLTRGTPSASTPVQAPPEESTTLERVLGAPRKLRVERRLSGEVGEDAHEDVITEIRRSFGEPGQFERLGRTLIWRHQVAQGGRDVSVTVCARDGATTIEVEERLGRLLGGLWGGVGGGVGGNLLIQPVVHGSIHGLWWLVALGPLLFTLIYAILRASCAGVARRRRAQLRQLADVVEAALARHARRPPRVDPKKAEA